METVSVVGDRFGWVIGAVTRNHVLTRLLLAYLVMIVAEFGQWLAVIVYAYVRGGASAAGLVVILQLIPSMLLAPLICAFALIESMRDLGMVISALAIPLLIGLGGAKTAFLGMACFALIAVLATARQIRRIDSEASIPVVEMGMLRNMGIFSALPAAPLETLAREAHYASVHPGIAIVSEGEEGDSYYAIAHGSVRVAQGKGEITQLGSGDGFGEIALLYPVRRIATVTATSETTLLCIGREAFLTAMRAHRATSSAAERTARVQLEEAS
jgi:Cyclic nucleotide-binding domain